MKKKWKIVEEIVRNAALWDKSVIRWKSVPKMKPLSPLSSGFLKKLCEYECNQFYAEIGLRIWDKLYRLSSESPKIPWRYYNKSVEWKFMLKNVFLIEYRKKHYSLNHPETFTLVEANRTHVDILNIHQNREKIKKWKKKGFDLAGQTVFIGVLKKTCLKLRNIDQFNSYIIAAIGEK